MKNNKYKILVLSDLKNDANSILKNTISLAKMIHADIKLFHVKKPTDIVERESQLSAVRVINKEQVVTNKKIENLLGPIYKNYGININSNFAFGNIKHEIEKYVIAYQPDIIVLGKRKAKAIKFIGDNVTDFVLKIHKGAVMIVSNESDLEPEKELGLGFLNGKQQSFNMKFTEDLIGQTTRPLKSFSIVEKSNITSEKMISTSNKTIDYVFEKNENTIKNLSNYLIKNNVNLLCIERENSHDKSSNMTSEIKDIIDKVNVSLFLTNREPQLVP